MAGGRGATSGQCLRATEIRRIGRREPAGVFAAQEGCDAIWAVGLFVLSAPKAHVSIGSGVGLSFCWSTSEPAVLPGLCPPVRLQGGNPPLFPERPFVRRACDAPLARHCGVATAGRYLTSNATLLWLLRRDLSSRHLREISART
jgi:hypothetical protein